MKFTLEIDLDSSSNSVDLAEMLYKVSERIWEKHYVRGLAHKGEITRAIVNADNGVVGSWTLKGDKS